MKKLRVAAGRGDAAAVKLLADVTAKLSNAVAIDPGEKDTFAMSDGRVLSTAIMNGRKTRNSTTIFGAGTAVVSCSMLVSTEEVVNATLLLYVCR